MRVAVVGQDDVVELIQVNGRWVSEDCEPVEIHPTPRKPRLSLSEADYICPPELASQLIHRLLERSEEDESTSDWLMQRGLDDHEFCRIS